MLPLSLGRSASSAACSARRQTCNRGQRCRAFGDRAQSRTTRNVLIHGSQTTPGQRQVTENLFGSSMPGASHFWHALIGGRALPGKTAFSTLDWRLRQACSHGDASLLLWRCFDGASKGLRRLQASKGIKGNRGVVVVARLSLPRENGAAGAAVGPDYAVPSRRRICLWALVKANWCNRLRLSHRPLAGEILAAGRLVNRYASRVMR